MFDMYDMWCAFRKLAYAFRVCYVCRGDPPNTEQIRVRPVVDCCHCDVMLRIRFKITSKYGIHSGTSLRMFHRLQTYIVDQHQRSIQRLIFRNCSRRSRVYWFVVDGAEVELVDRRYVHISQCLSDATLRRHGIWLGVFNATVGTKSLSHPPPLQRKRSRPAHSFALSHCRDYCDRNRRPRPQFGLQTSFSAVSWTSSWNPLDEYVSFTYYTYWQSARASIQFDTQDASKYTNVSLTPSPNGCDMLAICIRSIPVL